MNGKSLNITEEKLNKLKDIIPEAFTENKVDWEKLKASLGDNIEFKNERYVLNWAGKSDSFRILQSPTTATLVPDRNESVDFDSTENIFIEGENLEVLKVLQKSYFGKIKMIYIDPPYNTGNDNFIYPDKFSETKEEYLSRIGDKDESGYMTREGLFRKNSKDSGHYHSNWLSMMYPRLFLARNLLKDDGVIFVSIDDNEVHNLRMIMNEVFGEENFVAQFTIINNLKGRNDKKNVATAHEFLLTYQKSDFSSYGFPLTEEQKKEYKFTDHEGYKYALRDLRKRGRPDKREDRPNMYFPIYFNTNSKRCSLTRISENDIEILPKRGDGSDGRWRWGYDTVKVNLNILEPRFSKAKDRWDIDHKVYLLDIKNPNNEQDYFEDDEIESLNERTSKPKSFLIGGDISTDVGRRNLKEILPEIEFDYPKAVEYLKKIVFYGSKGSDIILDFFAGSATTAHAVMDLNYEDSGSRKYICVQLPEKTDEKSEAFKAGYKTIADIGKERIRRVIKKIKEEQSGKLDLEGKENQDLGFKVFKLQDSNFKIWRSKIENEEQLLEQLQDHLEPLDENAKTEDVLYELLLKSGIPLTAKIEKKNGIFVINENEIALLLEKINEKLIKEVIELKPWKVITLDRLFNNNDQLKTNTALQMKDAEIEFKVV
ncbi:MAG: site-specific DNA-methyltransferase [Candidatus Delongbacteria bacterium]|jgi:adenine-specific DNA-methyltransferase|nr:site-specific DNA-methyltransferase [Candidatus Delongbacteria bacterium]